MATGHTVATFAETLRANVYNEGGPNVVELIWLLLLVPWSVTVLWVGLRVMFGSTRRRVARLALLLTISAPASLLVVSVWSQGWSDESLTPNIIGLLGMEQFRPLVLLSVIPLVVGWALLLELPSISRSQSHRRVVHLGLLSELLLCSYFAFTIREDGVPRGSGIRWSLGTLGGLGFRVVTLAVAFALFAIAVVMVRTARHSDDPLATPLRQLEGVIIPLAVVAAGVVTLARLNVESADLVPLIGYFISILPLTALVVLIHDYLIVGGARFLPSLLAAQHSPAEFQSVLRRALGDPMLRLVFHLSDDTPDLVGIDGRTIDADELEQATSETIFIDGAPIAAIIWSVESPHAHGRTSALLGVTTLAIERAQLQAKVVAQMAHLEDSRRRNLEAYDRGRRAVERDLHDGVQQHLVASIHAAQRAADASADLDARELADQTCAHLEAALTELRDVAQGIYPATLSSGGLAAAIEALAQRSPLIVVTRVDVRQAPPEIELTAYYVVAETLTNAAKHSGADAATVEVSSSGSSLVVEVSDAGSGHIDPAGGSGLRGLADRCEAVGGRFEIEGLRDVGTVVRAVLPSKGPAVIDLSEPGRLQRPPIPSAANST